MINAAKTAASWGPFFHGRAADQLTRAEDKARSLILDGMAEAAAEKVLARLHPETPLFCRITFIETLAAICTKYDAEVSRKVTGTAKEVRRVLWSACAPERLEYLFNNLRARHSLSASSRALLPVGTTSNEALHAEINSWTRPIHELHRSTFHLELQILQLGKLLSHNVALCHPPLRQMQDNHSILARASCAPIWSDATWESSCSAEGKAPVPLHRQRVREVDAVRKHASTKQRVRKKFLYPGGAPTKAVELPQGT